LVRGDAGIWTVGDATAKVSFPEHHYDACFAVEDRSFWLQHRNACLVAALRHHPFDGVFLDVGGGNGAVSKALVEHGFETVLLEPGPDGARNARTRGITNVVCATLEQAAFEDGAFGAAGLFDVIEHVEDDEAILRQAHRAIRPGGIVCVTVPAYSWLWSAEDELAGHYRRYTTTSLVRLLERVGFHPVYSTYFFAALTAPMFLLRTLPHRLWKRAPEAVERGAAEQHTPSGTSRRAIDRVLAGERRRLEQGKSMAFGTSCLAIARR
jgi:SAM-dependent methyltransferase